MTPDYRAGIVGLLAHILADHQDRPDAACIGHESVFDIARWPGDADTPADAQHASETAASICARCPHTVDCSYAYGGTP